jgi:thiamine-monophosphate kinase
MKICELGEFGLIEMIAKTAGKPGGDEVLIGIGDDAACWRARGLQLATTDTLIEGIHFDLRHITWRELGWKSIAVNLSDIAAMGGRPRYALVTLGLPGDIEVDNIIELYKGMAKLARKFDVQIVGGDMVGAPIVAVTIALIGEIKDESKLLRRSAAKPGDMIAVTGHLGASAAGLVMMQRKLSIDKKTAATLRKAHCKPNPRIEEGQTLAQHGVKAAMDISDGLVIDLEKICLASKASARIYSASLPIHPSVKRAFGGESIVFALSGGEDYELLFTAPQKVVASVKKSLNCPVTVIGEIVAGKGVKVFDENGKKLTLKDIGWDHFLKSKRR